MGPSASVFHSGASKSVAETKVGSPPMVRRTSPAASARSTAAPIARMSCHCASVYGLVTRGVSRTRVTVISKPNSVSHFSTAPVIGAADCGSGVAASGMWPSPVSRPEVASRPTQPAPGRYDLGPGVQVGEVGGRALRPVQRLHVGDELDQIAGDEARGVAEMAQRLHQQPGGIAAGALAGGQRLLRRPDAGLHAHDVGDAALHRAVELDQHVDGAAARRAALRPAAPAAAGRSARAGGTARVPAPAPGRS